MKVLIKEISQIPVAAAEAYKKNRGLQLPTNIPYLGMGSSYYAPLTLFYAGVNIFPQIAAEYFNRERKIQPLGVLISQSGQSSEVLWNLSRFQKVVAITNDRNSPLALSKKCQLRVFINAGEEQASATKTYINTLAVLYLGLGINPQKGIDVLFRDYGQLDRTAKKQSRRIFKYLKTRPAKGLYVLGSGPNVATASEAALALSEITKYTWTGLPLSQYDHGMKETARNSVVVFLESRGKEEKRSKSIQKVLQKKSNALIVSITQTAVPENLSPFPLVAQIYLLANYLADFLGVRAVYELGKKVTKRP